MWLAGGANTTLSKYCARFLDQNEQTLFEIDGSGSTHQPSGSFNLGGNYYDGAGGYPGGSEDWNTVTPAKFTLSSSVDNEFALMASTPSFHHLLTVSGSGVGIGVNREVATNGLGIGTIFEVSSSEKNDYADSNGETNNAANSVDFWVNPSASFGNPALFLRSSNKGGTTYGRNAYLLEMHQNSMRNALFDGVGNQYCRGKLYFDTYGGAEYISGSATDIEIAAAGKVSMNTPQIDFGEGDTGDPTINFTGTNNNGRLIWDESADNFTFADDVLMNSTERLYFTDIGDEYIFGSADGVLALKAGTSIDLVASVLNIGLGTTADPALTFKGTNNTVQQKFDESAGKLLYGNTSAGSPYVLVLDTVEAYVGIGQGVNSPAYALDVSGSEGQASPDTNGFVARFFNDGGHYNNGGIIIQCSEDDGAPAKQTIYLRANDGNGDITGHLSINSSGVFSLTDSSDEKLKDNIRPTKYVGLDVIKGINIYDFEWKKSGKTRAGGFVAQNVEKFFPEAVDDTVEDGGEITKGVSYGVLVAPAIKAIQEQQEIIEKLLARVEELEKKIN